MGHAAHQQEPTTASLSAKPGYPDTLRESEGLGTSINGTRKSGRHKMAKTEKIIKYPLHLNHSRFSSTLKLV